jgi:hypothetical protein
MATPVCKHLVVVEQRCRPLKEVGEEKYSNHHRTEHRSTVEKDNKGKDLIVEDDSVVDDVECTKRALICVT